MTVILGLQDLAESYTQSEKLISIRSVFKVMKFLKITSITSLILIAGLVMSSGPGHEFFEKAGLIAATLFNDPIEPDQEKQTVSNSAISIKNIGFQHQQLLQQKYLMAAGNSGMFPDNLDEKEKKAFVQEALSDLYHSDEVGDRELAVMTLGEFTGKEATEAMLFALNDPDDIVREQAIMQISDWKNEKERTELVLKVLQGHDPDALVLILESVTDIDDEALAAKIKELLDHPDETVREAAQLALELQD